MDFNHLCQYCGENFITKYNNSKYCSHHCANMGRPSKPMTQQQKYKLSQSQKLAYTLGRKAWNKGKPFSIETRKKMSESAKQKPPISKETRKKMSDAHRGEKHWMWRGGYKASQERKKQSIKYRLNRRIGCLIRNNITQGSKKNVGWEKLLGYSHHTLKLHLEKTIPYGYSWTDFLAGELHIDHIIPINAFNFDSPEHIDFKRCWALENLRLLPAKENLIKGKKLNREFQPCLKI